MSVRCAIGLALVRAAPQPTPPACLPSESGIDAFAMEWFCRELRAAGQGRLEVEPGYRFTYLPSFHHTRVVVATMENGQPVVLGTVVSREAGHGPREILQRTRRLLSPDEWRLLEQRLLNAGIWEATDTDSRSGADGAQWLLEGRRRGQHSVHDVWSPTDETFPQYRKACVYMLAVAGIMPEANELY